MRTSLVVALLAMGALPAAAQTRLSKPVVDTVNHHIVRVTNNGPSAWADTNGWKLVLERTVQPPDGSPGMLDNPDNIILMSDGRLIVRQSNPVSVQLYDRQGKYLRTIGRVGAGPGEYRDPEIALYHDTLVTYDGGIGRASLSTLDGKFLRTFLTDIHDDGSRIAVDSRGYLRVEQGRSKPGFSHDWIYFDLKGKRVDSVATPEAVHLLSWNVHIEGGSMSRAIPNAPQNLVATFGDGSFVVGATNQYAFTRFLARGDTTRIFARSGVTAGRISAARRDSLFARIQKVTALRNVASESDIPWALPVVRDAIGDALGNLWVMSAASATNLDVFGSDGTYLGAVASPVKDFWRTSWTADHVAVFNTDTNDLPRIQIYRIDRRGH